MSVLGHLFCKKWTKIVFPLAIAALPASHALAAALPLGATLANNMAIVTTQTANASVRYDNESVASHAHQALTKSVDYSDNDDQEASVSTDELEQQSEGTQTMCMAKVIYHEAANQSREGQIAIAQLILNRAERGGRFPQTVCGVTNQPGQFFDTTRYTPPRQDRRWQKAIEIAHDVLTGSSEDLTQGALFYHANSQAPNHFFKTRTRVRMLGSHIFYR
ncbi:MAG: cell wall hydrolase [Zymomonas mobilis subsp. pomaceae]|uniref:Cell wall hydrolase SleB n=1 Tax=Zymomonas mobilis subsp. pomaceae (strain ATCC 29192 / DSM 22645 / JCM 10191 / CCUG 17912 / NBRC 13757 / NCIMB 11200 / NRRL B-4491 / Barker I) TaxID=579138 RepID=F8ES89_ZYMMT|nr:cell wall hydrolase [Zymomonas mobilis]AEI37664.1 cell wall hydrolase SleB [Zymomonas mobilis subsp. pomaceae ATCC 29192]MDX5949032.1 cell wall hydrolase [Zymomonas mobilis subsp. pomaceae]GEB88837.1 hypothetical protein ZMO02_04740 [Zymomonas mobilis subsp. pomaceae]